MSNNQFNQTQLIIDNEIYMAPSKYLLVLNISKVYNALSFCKNELEKQLENLFIALYFQ